MTNQNSSSSLNRKTFAIIAHPDAGKTTLTEKLLLLGGAIQMAGAVRARGEQRRTKSDWMKIERDRGISVTASVMSFDYDNFMFNLLDTPGHEDFSEDTYRTLTAVDSAVMVLDCAKGIESQTLKLFEVCRLRDIPIITFINKIDRESKNPFDLLDEIQDKLVLEVTPITWPIGTGMDFKGCYNRFTKELHLIGTEKNKEEMIQCQDVHDPIIAQKVGQHLATELVDHIALIEAVFPDFNLEMYQQGHQTPIFFGSALKNFGVKLLLDGLRDYAPAPRPQKAVQRIVAPTEAKVSGFVFKVQANMDPNHRDRIAFFRVCSGTYERGKKLKHIRSGKIMAINNAVFFLAQDRELAQTAYPGDIIGIPNHGTLRIGDTITEGEDITYTGVPLFAPEILQRVRPIDPMKVKHLRKALEHFAEEGASHIFKPTLGADWIVGVVGQLQFEVLASRLQVEYSVQAIFEQAPFVTARWLSSSDSATLKKFIELNQSAMGFDHDEFPVYLARNQWQLDRAIEENPEIHFMKTREISLKSE